jgi:hypothetical protein
MFDISQMYYNSPDEFNTVQSDAYGVWSSCSETYPFSAQMAQVMQEQFNITVIGQHYFVSVNGALQAVWDLTSGSEFFGNSGAIVFAEKLYSVHSPDGSQNIDWVELGAISGALASKIYRIETVMGQPPQSVRSSRSMPILFNQRIAFL